MPPARSRGATSAPVCRFGAGTSSPGSGLPSTRWPSQLENRLEDLAEERGRTRDALTRFGEALAATNDPLQLLPVIVESIVEATGASGGRLLADGEELARAGRPDPTPAGARDPARRRHARGRPPAPDAAGPRLHERQPRAGPLARLAGLDGARERPAPRSPEARGRHRRPHGAPEPARLPAGARDRARARRAPERNCRPDHGRPRRLQAGQRPAWPPRRRRRPAHVRRCAPRDGARDRRRGALRRRGVRGRAARPPTSKAPSSSPSACARRWPRGPFPGTRTCRSPSPRASASLPSRRPKPRARSVAAADDALYAAKRAGKNCVRVAVARATVRPEP